MSKILKAALMVSAVSTLAACASTGSKDAPVRIPEVKDPAPIVSGTMRPYQIRGRWYHPKHEPDYDETGLASWYGDYHHGRPTSTGERFDMNALTAAHKTLPLPSLVEVTNTANGRRAVLRVNDRGPFVDRRIIDLSKGAAEELGLMARGVGEVRVRYLGPAPRTGGGMALSASTAASSAPASRSSARREDRFSDQGAVPYNEVVASERQAARPAPVSRTSPQTAQSAQGRVYLPGAAPIHNSVVPAPRVLPPVSAPIAPPVVPAPVPIPAPVPAPAPVPTHVPRAEPMPAAVIPPAAAPIVAAPLPAPATEPAPVYVPAPVPLPAPALLPVAPPAATPIEVPSVLSGHWVQAAAYADAATARRFADRLGSQALVLPFPANGQTFYRILVGPWPDANAAERARQAIIARGYREALLISAS